MSKLTQNRQFIGPSSIWMVQNNVTQVVLGTVFYLDSPNLRNILGPFDRRPFGRSKLTIQCSRAYNISEYKMFKTNELLKQMFAAFLAKQQKCIGIPQLIKLSGTVFDKYLYSCLYLRIPVKIYVFMLIFALFCQSKYGCICIRLFSLKINKFFFVFKLL